MKKVNCETEDSKLTNSLDAKQCLKARRRSTCRLPLEHPNFARSVLSQISTRCLCEGLYAMILTSIVGLEDDVVGAAVDVKVSW